MTGAAMSRRPTQWITAMLVLALGASLSADRVRLRSGKVVSGTFIGADSRAVRILLDDGQVSEVPIEETAAIEFSARKPAAAPAPAAAAAPKPPANTPAPAAKPKPIVVPAGTALNVRLTQAVEADVSYAGQTFKAIVDDPVTLNGAIVIPRGASGVLQAVKVEQSGKMKGSDRISLKLHSIGFGGKTYEVSSEYVETKGKGEGKKTARKTAGGAGLGAIVGGIAGGGKGAAIGAAVGGVGGAVMSATGEEHLKLDAETRLQFKLTSSVTIQP
jgi:hypothetical protein